MTNSGRPIELLLVEDNESDIRLTQIALRDAKLANNLNVVRDGEEALSYLRKSGDFIDATRPDMILLDLNLPKVDGAAVLKEIREDANLKLIPVMVLTCSDSDHDIFASYELQANCYITKPVDLRKFVGVIEMIEDFWLRGAKL